MKRLKPFILAEIKGGKLKNEKGVKRKILEKMLNDRPLDDWGSFGFDEWNEHIMFFNDLRKEKRSDDPIKLGHIPATFFLLELAREFLLKDREFEMLVQECFKEIELEKQERQKKFLRRCIE